MTQGTNNGRNSDGTFGKGNKCQKKKDFTKEMATHVASQELYWAIRQCSETTITDLQRMVKDGTLGGESLFTYTAIKKAVDGDFKPIQWLWEMAIGKPKQHQEISNPSGKAFKLSYQIDDGEDG